jgi:hypothetical protein
MDTLFWIQYNPNIEVEHAVKKFYGRYLYKLVLYVPGGRTIYSRDPVDVAHQHRIDLAKSMNHAGYWGYNRFISKNVKEADLVLLETLRSIRQSRLPGIKIRVEEPMCQIYAETEQQLQDLTTAHLLPFTKIWKGLSGPANDQTEAILNRGAIIKKTDNGYRYKVILRDGRYEGSTKVAILQYLVNCGTEHVGIPPSTKDMLVKSSGYIWNCYFHVNDLDLISFITLICPGIVSNTHELVVLDNK